jgi:tetratricopeptide (TPR) repeat protein|tara:strand:- start:263 stop:2041 length:1779 start_codon:yes stop_codon:yes gene_type:complete
MQNLNQTLQTAIALHQGGNLTGAAQLYEDILSIDKTQSDAHNLLGAVYVATKKFKLAEKHLLKATKYAKNYAPAHYNLGKAYLDQHKHHLAQAAFSKAVKLDPDYADALFLLANTRVHLGAVALAKPLFEQVIKLTPNNYEAHNNLGSALQELGSTEASIPHLKRAITLNPSFELAYRNLGFALANLERHEETLEVFLTCLKHCPSARTYQFMGSTLQQLGRMDEARQAYLKAIELDPAIGSAYRHISEITKLDNSNGVDVESIVQAGFDVPNMPEDSIMHLSFALAKVNDGQKNYAEAFAAYKQGNDIKRKEYRYNKGDSNKLFKLLASSYNEKFLSQASNSGLKENKPIFILGMPRSGTTLVEQIISSHTQVTGAGELSYMANQAKQFKGGLLAFHKRFPNMGEDQWQAIAQAYLTGLNAYDEGKAHITDKMPHNFINIGMISKLLPNAKIIHCKRNPVANCLSLYKAYFGGKNAHPYAYNLKDLAHYHNLYEDLMTHWRKVLPGRFYEVSYEQLTSNQEPESRQLIEYCGLEWQDACLDFHKTQRKVKTASAFQVRQPMHNQSVDLWKRYGDALQPLLEDLYIPKEYRT